MPRILMKPVEALPEWQATVAAGMPIVIWRSAKPREPVQYFNQKKAWMTGEIMDAVLTKLNRQLLACPASLKEKYSNIKIPTSKLQT